MSAGGHRLGTSLAFAVKRWPEPQLWAELVAGWGMSDVQFSWDLCDPLWDAGFVNTYVAASRRAVEGAGLSLHSTFTGLCAYSLPMLAATSPQERSAAELWWERAIDLSAEAGARHMGGYLGTLSLADHAAGPSRRAELLRQVADALARLAARAQSAGLEGLLIENMPQASELVSTRQEARALCRSGVELCLDVGHMCQPGATADERDPYLWLRQLGSLAPVIHLQQADAGDDRHWPFTAEFNARGRIDPRLVMGALAGSGREHLFCLEILPGLLDSPERVVDAHRQSAELWSQTLRA